MRGLEAGPRPQPRPRIDPNGLDGYFSTIVQPQKLTVSQSIVDGVPRILGNIDTTLSEFAGNHSVTRERSNLRLVHSVPNEEVSEAEKTAPLLRRPNKETVGSDAFNLEYDSPPTQAELRRDIEAYLKEYRLKVQKHDYRLLFGRQADGIGPITLRDEDRGESLSRRAKRSVASRQLKEQPIHREEAEDEGLRRIWVPLCRESFQNV